jgi:hypothetical protein
MKASRSWRNLGSLAVAAAIAVIGLAREALTLLMGGQENANELRPNESEVTGEYNYRTGRLDDGTDPYGWYEPD